MALPPIHSDPRSCAQCLIDPPRRAPASEGGRARPSLEVDKRSTGLPGRLSCWPRRSTTPSTDAMSRWCSREGTASSWGVGLPTAYASGGVALMESSRHRRATSGSVESGDRAYPDDGLVWSASITSRSGAYPMTCAKSQARLYCASPPTIGSIAIAGRSAFRGQRRRTEYRASLFGPRRGGWRRSERGCSTCRRRPQSGHQGSRARRSAACSKALTGPKRGLTGWTGFARSRRRAGSRAR